MDPGAYLYFLPLWDDYSPDAGLIHINELKFSLYGGAACYQPSRLEEQSLNSMQLQHQQQQPVEKLVLLLKQ